MKMNTRVILVCLLLSLPFTWYSYQKQMSEKDKLENQTSSNEVNMNPGDVYERPYSPTFGPDSAKVTIVEYFDPACGACRAFYPIVKEIQSRHQNDVRVVLRYATFHQGSETVVRMLEAARLQNKFQELLEALLAEQSEWTINHQVVINKAWEIAQKIGLDIELAKRELNSETIDKRLQQEKEDIRALKVSKTPTFYVNQQALTQFGVQELYDLVVKELEKP